MDKNIMEKKQVFVGTISATDSNPNGDRDNNGAPRQNMLTGRGEISDACFKRWLRETLCRMFDNVELYIDSDRPMNEKTSEAVAEAAGMTLDELMKAMKKDRNAFLPVQEYLFNRYYDIRAFGAVLANLNRAIKGPVQAAISLSVLPVDLKTFALTSKGIATAKQFYEDGSNTMFGEKTVVRHGLYIIRGEISAVQAAETGFTEEDKDMLFQAMAHMFDFNKSAARADMRLHDLYNFEYPDRLGLEPPTHVLWDAVKVTPVPEVLDGTRPATQYSDYIVALDESVIPDAITVHKLV